VKKIKAETVQYNVFHEDISVLHMVAGFIFINVSRFFYHLCCHYRSSFQEGRVM